MQQREGKAPCMRVSSSSCVYYLHVCFYSINIQIALFCYIYAASRTYFQKNMKSSTFTD